MVINDSHLKWLAAIKRFIVRYRRVLLIGGISIFAAVIAGQLLYPAGKGLPLARIGSASVALESEAVLSEKVHALFQEATITLQVGDKKFKSTLAAAGAELRSDAMVRRATDYPLWQRFVPFSFLFTQVDLAQLQVSFNNEQLTEYTQKVSSQLTVAPVDAGLTISDGKLAVTEPRDGSLVTAGMIREKMTNRRYDAVESVIRIEPTVASPVRSMKDIEPVRTEAEAYIARKLTLVSHDGKTIEVAPIDIASWLSVEEDENKQVRLVIKDEAVAVYVSGVAKRVDVVPGVAQARVVDGIEASRTGAPSGLGVKQAELVSSLKGAVASADEPRAIKLPMGPVAPTVRYERSYSSSRAGLQAYVEYVGQSSNTRIAITQLDGSGWSVGARADEGTVAASTYKTFLSLVLFDKIRTGELRWNDSIQGYDMATCLEKTIVLSANECAEELLGKFGRTNINNFLYSRGISRATTFTNPTATQTSAADLNRLMIGLHNNSLLSGDERSSLLDKMGRQIYRRGIPAGSKGVVQDKVGFLWDYLNDSGIIRHPKGTYAMTILTKGSSWENIAQITRDVEGIMYP